MVVEIVAGGLEGVNQNGLCGEPNRAGVVCGVGTKSDETIPYSWSQVLQLINMRYKHTRHTFKEVSCFNDERPRRNVPIGREDDNCLELAAQFPELLGNSGNGVTTCPRDVPFAWIVRNGDEGGHRFSGL